MTELKITQADRFWSKVDVRGENDCWRWLGSKTAKGYGLVSKRRATHIALELSGKPRPESARLVRHIARARREMGEARWDELQREWL